MNNQNAVNFFHTGDVTMWAELLEIRPSDWMFGRPVRVASTTVQMKEQHKEGHSQYCWNNKLLIMYRFLQQRFYLVRETEPNEVVRA